MLLLDRLRFAAIAVAGDSNECPRLRQICNLMLDRLRAIKLSYRRLEAVLHFGLDLCPRH